MSCLNFVFLRGVWEFCSALVYLLSSMNSEFENSVHVTSARADYALPAYFLQFVMTLDNKRKLAAHFEPIRSLSSPIFQDPSGDVGCHRHTTSHDQIPFKVFNNSRCLGISLPNQP